MSHSIIQRTYVFEGHDVRTLSDAQGEPWFVAKDVCDVLDLSNVGKAISQLDDDEKNSITISDGTPGNPQKTIISEAGFYKLVLRSRKPEAKRFRKWVTGEVLPSIRKHGGYMAGQESMSPEQMALASIQWLQSKVAEQQKQLAEQAPKVLFADSVSASKDSILVHELAKLISQNGVKIGEKRLYQWLREHGYVGSRGGYKNVPAQRYVEQGLFEIKKRTISSPDGSVITSHTTMVTGKGQRYFIEKFLARSERLEA